jgi:tripartite-type tricarboxylate transporter receptor subunit TctC
MIAGIGDILEHVKANRSRPVGVTSLERVAQLPDVPTIADSVPGFECTTWVSIFAPAGTPKAIVDQLHAELGNALRDPNVASRLSAVTYDAVIKSPEELNQRVKADYAQIGKLFRDLGVSLD